MKNKNIQNGSKPDYTKIINDFLAVHGDLYDYSPLVYEPKKLG
jgi:hypothetical protein